MGVIAKGIPRGCQGLFTPVSLGYPLSVFNKNSTLKQKDSKISLGVGRRDSMPRLTSCTAVLFIGFIFRKACSFTLLFFLIVVSWRALAIVFHF